MLATNGIEKCWQNRLHEFVDMFAILCSIDYILVTLLREVFTKKLVQQRKIVRLSCQNLSVKTKNISHAVRWC